jgi:cytoskeletal protein CcmA (bactofilin family)
MNIEKKMIIRSDIPGHHAMLGSAPDSNAGRLVIGAGLVLNSAVSGCDHLVVGGTMEGDNVSARRLDVIEGGLVRGTAPVQEANIAGTVEGKLVVTGKLVVEATGRIIGDVEYGALEVKNGGQIEGTLRALEPSVHTQAPSPSQTAPAVPPVAAARRQEERRKAADASNVEPLFDGDGQPGRPRVFRKAG